MELEVYLIELNEVHWVDDFWDELKPSIISLHLN